MPTFGVGVRLHPPRTGLAPLVARTHNATCAHVHTGYPGGMKEVKARDYWKRDPTEILREAVSGMLPKNHLRKNRMMKLRLFPVRSQQALAPALPLTVFVFGRIFAF